MRISDGMARVLVQRKGVRWLREELRGLEVSIPLTDGCLAEFVASADHAARGAYDRDSGYVTRFREQLAERARFIERWTGTDEDIMREEDVESLQGHVAIARKYALPRRWKLTETTVVEYRRLRPSYWDWTSDLDANSVRKA